MPNHRIVGFCLALALIASSGGAAHGQVLRVVATVPDLGDLAVAVGGEDVTVTVLTLGPQDPHFVEPRPSFIRKLHDADLFVLVGMDLEVGWVPALLRSARNARIAPGAPGYLDASAAIVPLEVPTGVLDRSMGDVHPYGNPHYLTDPVNGVRVARLLRDTLSRLRPGAAERFAARFDAFEIRIAEALVGRALVARYGAAAVIERVEAGGLAAWLAEQGQSDALAGWLGAMRPHEGAVAVQDHRLWAYFTRRFGLVVVETFEPKPGIEPTTRHLTNVIAAMQERNAKLILSTAYYDPRHARWVTERTGARVARMAHQVGAQDGTDDYIAAVDYNVRQVLEAM